MQFWNGVQPSASVRVGRRVAVVRRVSAAVMACIGAVVGCKGKGEGDGRCGLGDRSDELRLLHYVFLRNLFVHCCSALIRWLSREALVYTLKDEVAVSGAQPMSLRRGVNSLLKGYPGPSVVLNELTRCRISLLHKVGQTMFQGRLICTHTKAIPTDAIVLTDSLLPTDSFLPLDPPLSPCLVPPILLISSDTSYSSCQNTDNTAPS